MKLKLLILAALIAGTVKLEAQTLDVSGSVQLLKKFEYQQLNYSYQKIFRFNGLYKSSLYVNEADIATTGFALAGLIAAAENGLLPIQQAQKMALETINTCINLQENPSQNYYGFLYHYYIYNEYAQKLEHKSGVEVSTIDTALLLAGIITAAEYFDSKGYPEVRKAAQKFYSNINWKMFFDPNRELFHMAWRGNFYGYWDFYSDEIFLISLLAQGSPEPEYRVDAKTVFSNIRVQRGEYKGYSYVYSWYGSLFTYLFAHIFVDFRKLGKDTIYNIDWWENSKNAILADIKWCQDNGYPKDIWGLSAAWSKIAPDSNNMEYRGRVGAALSGDGDKYENDKNGIKIVSPSVSIASLPFFSDRPLSENPAFKTFLKIRQKAVDRSGLLIESLDASRLDKDGIPEVDSNWTVGMDIVFPALMIENYFTNLIWDNFMKNFQVQFALLKTFPSYYIYLAKK